jgi:hypothetical protein
MSVRIKPLDRDVNVLATRHLSDVVRISNARDQPNEHRLSAADWPGDDVPHPRLNVRPTNEAGAESTLIDSTSP